MTESLVKYSWRTFFFLARVAIGTWLALIVMVAGHIAWVQSRPAADYVDLHAVRVDMDGPEVVARLERNVTQDADVIVAAELSSVEDPSFQPCVAGFRSIADRQGSPVVTVPLSHMLGNCDLRRLARLDQSFRLKVIYTIELDYGIRKRASAESEPFKLPVNAQ